MAADRIPLIESRVSDELPISFYGALFAFKEMCVLPSGCQIIRISAEL